MQLRTFIAKDMKEALRSVRAEMGPDAVIVGSERAKNGVLVRAALDAPSPHADNDSFVAPENDSDTRYREALVRRLRVEPAEGRPRFDRARLLQRFACHRLPEQLSHALAESSAKTGLSDMTLALASSIEARLKTLPVEFNARQTLMLLGAHGAGKTATAAKLAAHARLHGHKVVLIAADVAGAGAVARLKEFADHLGAEVVTAPSAEALARLADEAHARETFAVIDTAGFDPREPKTAAAFQALAKIEGVDSIAVVSALCDAEEAGDLAGAFSRLGARRLIVTAADLARRMGALVAAATSGLPLAHVTCSPFVAGGLECPSALSLARLLIDEGGAK